MEDKLDFATKDMESRAGAGTRIFREVIRTPAFREIISAHVTEFDPESVRQMVQTFLWEDPSFMLGMAAKIPSMVNFLAVLGLEMGKQLTILPGGMIEQSASALLPEIDTEVFKQFPEVFAALRENIDVEEMRAAIVGRAVNTMSERVIKTLAENPYVMRDTMRSSMAQVDRKLLRRVMFAVSRSMFLTMVSSVTGLMGRIRDRIRPGRK